MHQIPCRDLIQAHCLRSWLLSHGIHADVIHENASGLYFPDTLPPHLAIEDEDLPRYLELSKEPDPPIDESFAPPDDAEVPKETPPATVTDPSLGGTILFGLIAGAAGGLALLLLSVLFSAAEDSSSLLSDGPLPPGLQSREKWPFIGAALGAVGGLYMWLAMLLAGCCKWNNGKLPECARWIAFVVMVCATDLILLLFDTGLLFRGLIQAFKTHFQ